MDGDFFPHRPRKVSWQEFSDNWEKAFGENKGKGNKEKVITDVTRCAAGCGKAIPEPGSPAGLLRQKTPRNDKAGVFPLSV